MALIKKCDRCKATYEPYNYKRSANHINGLRTANIDLEQCCYHHGPYDLCPTCSETFMKWMFQDRVLEED